MKDHHWRFVSLWRLSISIERRGIEWCNHAPTMSLCLRSRTGKLYDYKHVPTMGSFIRLRRDDLFQLN